MKTSMGEQHTAKCRDLLSPEFRSRFSVLAQAFQRPARLWRLLSLLVYSFRTKHYVIGFEDRDGTLYLFRLSMGLFGVGQATGYEKFAVKELLELDYQEHFFAASFSFRKPDGTKVKLFVPNPSKENAKEIYGSDADESLTAALSS